MLALALFNETVDLTCPEWRAILEGPNEADPDRMHLHLPELGPDDRIDPRFPHWRRSGMAYGPTRGGVIVTFPRLRAGDSIGLTIRGRRCVLRAATGRCRVKFECDRAIQILRRGARVCAPAGRVMVSAAGPDARPPAAMRPAAGAHGRGPRRD